MMMMMIIIIMMTIIIMIIIIITFKGAVPDFLQSPHCAESYLQHVRSSGPAISNTYALVAQLSPTRTL